MSEITEKPGYWSVCPTVILFDDVITPNAKLLYMLISSLTGLDGYCWASNRYLAGKFKFSERTVRNLLEALRNGGYIRIEDGAGKNRKIYAGINPLAGRDKDGNPEKICRVEDEPGKDLPGNPEKIFRQNNINYNNIPPIAPQGAGVSNVPSWMPERFAKFWEFYRPHEKRGNRKRAVKAWDALKPDDVTLRRMGAGLKLLMAGEEWQRGIGIPHVSTWLNGRYWEDALENAADDDEGSSGWAPDPEVMHHV